MRTNTDRKSRPQVVLVNRALVLNNKGKILLIKRSKDDSHWPGKYKDFPYIVLVGTAKAIGGHVRLSAEHDDYAWVSKNKVFEYDLAEETRGALTVLISKLEK